MDILDKNWNLFVAQNEKYLRAIDQERQAEQSAVDADLHLQIMLTLRAKHLSPKTPIDKIINGTNSGKSVEQKELHSLLKQEWEDYKNVLYEKSYDSYFSIHNCPKFVAKFWTKVTLQNMFEIPLYKNNVGRCNYDMKRFPNFSQLLKAFNRPTTAKKKAKIIIPPGLITYPEYTTLINNHRTHMVSLTSIKRENQIITNIEHLFEKQVFTPLAVVAKDLGKVCTELHDDPIAVVVSQYKARCSTQSITLINELLTQLAKPNVDIKKFAQFTKNDCRKHMIERNAVWTNETTMDLMNTYKETMVSWHCYNFQGTWMCAFLQHLLKSLHMLQSVFTRLDSKETKELCVNHTELKLETIRNQIQSMIAIMQEDINALSTSIAKHKAEANVLQQNLTQQNALIELADNNDISSYFDYIAQLLQNQTCSEMVSILQAQKEKLKGKDQLGNFSSTFSKANSQLNELEAEAIIEIKRAMQDWQKIYYDQLLHFSKHINKSFIKGFQTKFLDPVVDKLTTIPLKPAAWEEGTHTKALVPIHMIQNAPFVKVLERTLSQANETVNKHEILPSIGAPMRYHMQHLKLLVENTANLLPFIDVWNAFNSCKALMELLTKEHVRTSID